MQYLQRQYLQRHLQRQYLQRHSAPEPMKTQRTVASYLSSCACPVVAIDGPSGAGKSTVAKELAKRLDCEFLDTGAMYRAVAWYVLDLEIPPGDAPAVAAVLEDMQIQPDGNTIMVSGKDITAEIRSEEVTAAAAAVATNSQVREFLVRQQQDWISQRNRSVVEGRDITTVVCPKACFRFFLTADELVRANRRSRETGANAQNVLEGQKSRDKTDSTRRQSPLRKVEGVVEVDTTETNADQAVEHIWKLMLNIATDGLAGAVQSAPESSSAGFSEKESAGAGSSGVGSSGVETSGSGDDSRGRRVTASTAAPPAAEPTAAASPVSEPIPEAPLAFSPYDFPAAKRYGEKRSLRMLLFYRFCRFAVLVTGKIFFGFRVRNAENLPKSGAVIIAPGGHRSNLDTPLTGMSLKRDSNYMAKDSLFKSRFWSAFLLWLGGFPVARTKLDRKTLKTALNVLERGELLVVFPEGARQDGPQIKPLLGGVAWLAAKSGAPVLPLGIGGSESVLPVGRKFPRFGRVRIVFGNLITPPESKAGRPDRDSIKQFTDRLSVELQALFDEAQEWARTPNSASNPQATK